MQKQAIKQTRQGIFFKEIFSTLSVVVLVFISFKRNPWKRGQTGCVKKICSNEIFRET